MSNKKVYDDDDGRTIVDMSDVDSIPTLLPKRKREEQQRPVSESELSSQDRRAILFGSIGAVLFIAAIFLVAAFIVICLMLAAWT